MLLAIRRASSRERLGRVGIAAGLAPIDIDKTLPAGVLHYVAAINSL
jgi:hypothetical protein